MTPKPRPTVHYSEVAWVPLCGGVVYVAEQVSVDLAEVNCLACNRRAAALILLGHKLA